MLVEYKQQLFEIVLVGLAFVALLSIIELLKRRDILHKETSRKAVHISVGFILASLPIHMDRWQIILTNLGFFFGVLLLSGIFHVFTAIHSVKRWTIGEFLYPLSTGLVVLVFTDLRVYTFAVFVLALSDGLAGLIGRSFGGDGYKIWHGTKSILGNIVFFIVTACLLLSFWIIVGTFNLTYVPLLLLFALILTVIETLLAGGFDNIAVPISSAIVAWFILGL